MQCPVCEAENLDDAVECAGCGRTLAAGPGAGEDGGSLEGLETTHFAPVARLTAAPIRWTEPGGDVVRTTSIPSLRAIEIAFGIAVAFQVTFSSGTSSRRPIVDARRTARSIPLRPCSSSAIRLPLGPT